jgi:hypothetical protein
MSVFVPTFPLYPNLANAVTKARKLTGSSNAFQVTDSYIVQQMHSFYSYDLPAKFRSLKLKDVYTFTTNVGQAVYPFNSELYITVEQPCYCSKREIKLFTDPWQFYGVNYNWQSFTNFTSGDGTTGPYSGFTTAAPFIASFNNDPGALITDAIGNQRGNNLFFPQGRVQNILITATAYTDNGIGIQQNVTDDGEGNLIQIFSTADLGGNALKQEYGYQLYRQYASSTPSLAGNATINYQTGEITGLVFAQAIPQGTPIQIQYNPKQFSIPLSIMYYQNQFTLAPIPDQGYTIELQCYRQPIQALLAADMSGNPELSEWWEILSVGAAKKIFEERLDSDGVMFIDKMLKERYDVIETRTYAQIGQQRINTIYTDQLTYNYGSGGGLTSFGSI